MIAANPVRYALILVAVIAVWINLNQAPWHRQNVIRHDVIGYHAYLPAALIEHDLSLAFLRDTTNGATESAMYWPLQTADGKFVIKMSMGMSVSYLPFWLVAHAISPVFGFEQDGYSPPYHAAILFSSVFYALLGLWLTARVLSPYFSSEIVAITIICLFLGTNLLYYTTFSGGMSHPVTMAGYAAMAWLGSQYHRSGKGRLLVWVGLVGGFLVLVRPTNLIAFPVAVFFGSSDFRSIGHRLHQLVRQWPWVTGMTLTTLLVVVPQLLYWKVATGQYLYYSYQDEHFFFDHPHILDGLFSFRKGWLIYTPLMAFALAGYFPLRRVAQETVYVSMFILLIHIYISFSWWCWWYGGSYSQRVMIDIFPLLAFPLAAWNQASLSYKPSLRRAWMAGLVFLLSLNVFQSFQAKYNIIHYDSMTMEYYFRVFGSMKRDPSIDIYLKHPDVESAKQGLPERE